MPLPSPQSLAIIGAGPVGLEAAVAALDRGMDVHVFEQGEVGSHPLAWGHVRMFTPWRANLGPRSRARLEAAGWVAPDLDAFPTGRELVERYLEPLARLVALKERVHAFAQVVHVSRHGLLRGEGGAARGAHPFRLLVRDQSGRESFLHAFALLDASGVYANPLWAGTGGIPARGELYLRPQMAGHVEDVLDLDRERYAARRTLVIGDGTYAALTVSALARLAAEAPGTTVAWATRATRDALYAGATADPLPERRALLERARALAGAAQESVAHVGGVEVEGFEFNSATHRYRVSLADGDAIHVEEVDRVISNVGFEPDERLARELAADEPRHAVIGHKSAGRAEDFLLADGYRQVEEVVARLAAESR